MKRQDMIKEDEAVKFPMDLQFFADESEEKNDDGNEEENAGGDDQDDESDEDGEEEEPKYTQKDMDDAIKKRLDRERRKWNRKEQQKKKSDQEQKTDETDASVVAAREAEERAEKAEMKVVCFENGVIKDSVDDVIALAKSYIDDDTDMEDAIEKVIEKYPHFCKSAESEEPEDKPKKKVYVKSSSSKDAPKTVAQNKAFLDQRYKNNPYYNR